MDRRPGEGGYRYLDIYNIYTNYEQAQPLKLIFTDQSKVSTSAGAENSVIQILGSLYDSLETTYGTFSTR